MQRIALPRQEITLQTTDSIVVHHPLATYVEFDTRRIWASEVLIFVLNSGPMFNNHISQR